MANLAVKPKIIIFLGSVRTGRMGERVSIFVRDTVEACGMEPIMFDPEKMPFEVLKQPIHFMKDPENEAPGWLKEANEAIKQADGFIIVSSEYNCGIPPALSNMMDYFPPSSYRHRPCGLVTYSLGSFGGVRASTILRPFASELGLITVPTYVPIPSVNTNFDEEGKCSSERIASNITKLITEVGWYANAINSYKKIDPLPIT